MPPYPSDAQLEDEAQALLDRAEALVPDDLPHATVLRTGLAAKEILSASSAPGTTSSSWARAAWAPAASILLGSVSRAVVAHSPVPVLIAQAQAAPAEELEPGEAVVA